MRRGVDYDLGVRATHPKQRNAKMIYPLSPAQKAIIAEAGYSVNFQGDDNDVACYMGRIALELFMAGKVAESWNCYLNNPLSCYGTTFAAWESSMKTLVVRHLENNAAMNSHGRLMAAAG
jgi:hypothetical protein